MHSALLIPELVKQICEHVAAPPTSFDEALALMNDSNECSWEQSIANLARTCTFFTDPSLDVLWESQHDLGNLLRCFPRNSWEITAPHNQALPRFRFLRPVTGIDFERPRFYAGRVRALGQLEDPSFEIAPEVYDELGVCLLGRPIFPRLRALGWVPHPLAGPAQFQGIDLVLSATIRRIHVSSSSDSAACISKLASVCSTLSVLKFRGHEPFDIDARCAMQSLITGLKIITSIAVDYLTEDSFRHLSTLQSLRRLTIYGADVADWKFHPLPTSPHPFPSIEELSFAQICMPAVRSILTTCPVLSLRTMDLSGLEMTDAFGMGSLFEAVMEHIRPENLTRLSAYTAEVFPLQGGNAYILDHQLLDVVLPCSNLVHLDLRLGLGFNLDDACVHVMAKAWPCIETLTLAPSYSYDAVSWCTSGVTLHALEALARNCPELTSLDLTLDATAVAMGPVGLSPPSPHHSLEFLNVGRSSVTAVPETAGFLYRLFPNLKLRPLKTRWDNSVDLDGRKRRWHRVEETIEGLRAEAQQRDDLNPRRISKQVDLASLQLSPRAPQVLGHDERLQGRFYVDVSLSRGGRPCEDALRPSGLPPCVCVGRVDQMGASPQTGFHQRLISLARSHIVRPERLRTAALTPCIRCPDGSHWSIPDSTLRSQTGLHQRLASLARSPRSKCSASLHYHSTSASSSSIRFLLVPPPRLNETITVFRPLDC
ncbi:hypothetical protein C8R46DRAFT_1231311 [Mycena filopes]|nr:hypothetical protein C8R46DRAFT_1231311 [Mycena filopes]